MEDLSWVLNGYAIVYAALLVFFGRLVERYRRDLSFLAGVALFTPRLRRLRSAQGVLGVGRIPRLAGGWRGVDDSDLAGAIARLLPAGKARRRGADLDGDRRLCSRAWAARRRFAANAELALDFPGQRACGGCWRSGSAGACCPMCPGHDVKRPDPLAALMVTGGIAALVLAIVKFNDWGWRLARPLNGRRSPPRLFCSAPSRAIVSRPPIRSSIPTCFGSGPIRGPCWSWPPIRRRSARCLLSVALWEQAGMGLDRPPDRPRHHARPLARAFDLAPAVGPADFAFRQFGSRGRRHSVLRFWPRGLGRPPCRRRRTRSRSWAA